MKARAAGLCLAFCAVGWLWPAGAAAQAQTELSAQQLQDLQKAMLQDPKDVGTEPTQAPHVAVTGPLVPYEEAMQKLKERPVLKTIDVEAALAKVKAPVTATPVTPSAGSRDKTIKALGTRRASPNKKPRAIPNLAAGNEAAKARVEKEMRPRPVDVNALYPARKTPPTFDPSKAKNARTGSLVPYDQVRKLRQQKQPDKAGIKSQPSPSAEK